MRNNYQKINSNYLSVRTGSHLFILHQLLKPQSPERIFFCLLKSISSVFSKMNLIGLKVTKSIFPQLSGLIKLVTYFFLIKKKY